MTAINVTDLTTGTLKGTGVFDQLMQVSKAHLEEEYNKGRLSGTDYANVYLGMVSNVMQQSMTFLLGQQQAAKQAELLQAQAEKTTEEKLLVIQQTASVAAEALNIPLSGQKLTSDKALVEQQTANLAAEVLNAVKQGNKLDADAALTSAQQQKVQADVQLIAQQQLNMVAEELLIQGRVSKNAQEISNLGAEKLKTDTEKTLISQQVTNQTAEKLLVDAKVAQISRESDNLISLRSKIDAETALVTQNAANAITTNNTMIKQQAKMDAEIGVLQQKEQTERAQTEDSVNNGTVAGVLGKQKLLYAAQTAGFSRDAEQKVLKTLVDTWAVRRTTDSGTTVNGTGFTDANIKDVVNKARAGIGLGNVS